MAERIVYVIGKCALHETPEPGGKVCAQLAEHAQVAAKALRDAAEWIAGYDLDGQEYRVETLLEDRADRIERQADTPAGDDEGGQE